MTGNAIANESSTPLSVFIRRLARACWNPIIKPYWRIKTGQPGSPHGEPAADSGVYENVRIDTGFKADLVVEDKLIVEIKSVELLASVHKKQLLMYLRLADKRLGLLINFHVALIKEGIARIVNSL